ncbi:MAG: winged helix-turn-helix transcriptional regulator [Burkholderiaceae bacterium]|nr:winged helix-turn-helix transcriptional regulator [Burkholderiaceae bacterium]
MERQEARQHKPVDTTQVLRRFRVVYSAIRGHFQEIEKKVGLGGAQVWALSVVRDNPGIGVGGVAELLDIHQSTASNLVKALMKKQLLAQERSTEDRRNVHLRIEPAGLAILEQVPGPFEGVLPRALAALPQQTLARLDDDLGTLIDILHADESAAGIPLAEL